LQTTWEGYDIFKVLKVKNCLPRTLPTQEMLMRVLHIEEKGQEITTQKYKTFQ
jgi:hypothetical protein